VPSNFYSQLLWTLLEKGQGSEKFASDALTDWELAQSRILFYLRASNVDPDLCLELAVQAYKRAKEKTKTDRGPVPEAMISLGEILLKHRILQNEGIDFDASIWRKWAHRFSKGLGLPEGKSLSAAALPPVARRHMPAAVLQVGRRHRVLPGSTADGEGRTVNKAFYLIGALVAILLIIFFGT